MEIICKAIGLLLQIEKVIRWNNWNPWVNNRDKWIHKVSSSISIDGLMSSILLLCLYVEILSIRTIENYYPIPLDSKSRFFKNFSTSFVATGITDTLKFLCDAGADINAQVSQNST